MKNDYAISQYYSTFDNMTSIAPQLEAVLDNFSKNAPDAIKTPINSARQSLSSFDLSKTIKVGDKLPPFNLPNANTFSWSWLSTVNRVNAQVQKVGLSISFATLLTHRTISDFGPDLRYHPRSFTSITRPPVIAGMSCPLFR